MASLPNTSTWSTRRAAGRWSRPRDPGHGPSVPSSFPQRPRGQPPTGRRRIRAERPVEPDGGAGGVLVLRRAHACAPRGQQQDRAGAGDPRHPSTHRSTPVRVGSVAQHPRRPASGSRRRSRRTRTGRGTHGAGSRHVSGWGVPQATTSGSVNTVLGGRATGPPRRRMSVMANISVWRSAATFALAVLLAAVGLPGGGGTAHAATGTPPTVTAGPDQTVTLADTAFLPGRVSDDGLPEPSVLQSTWTTVSGPGEVRFGRTDEAHTSAEFSAAGTYVLRLASAYKQSIRVATTSPSPCVQNGARHCACPRRTTGRCRRRWTPRRPGHWCWSRRTAYRALHSSYRHPSPGPAARRTNRSSIEQDR